MENETKLFGLQSPTLALADLLMWLGKSLHCCSGNLSMMTRVPSDQSMDTDASTSSSSSKEKKLLVFPALFHNKTQA